MNKQNQLPEILTSSPIGTRFCKEKMHYESPKLTTHSPVKKMVRAIATYAYPLKRRSTDSILTRLNSSSCAIIQNPRNKRLGSISRGKENNLVYPDERGMFSLNESNAASVDLEKKHSIPIKLDQTLAYPKKGIEDNTRLLSDWRSNDRSNSRIRGILEQSLKELSKKSRTIEKFESELKLLRKRLRNYHGSETQSTLNLASHSTHPLSNHEFEKLRVKNNKLREMITSKDLTIQRLQESLNSVECKLGKYENERSDLKEMLNLQRIDIDEAFRQILEERREKEDLMEINIDQEARIHQLLEKIDGFKVKFKISQRNSKSQSKSIQSDQCSQLISMKENVSLLHSTNLTLQKTINSLEMSNSELKNEILILNSELVGMREDLEKLHKTKGLINPDSQVSTETQTMIASLESIGCLTEPIEIISTSMNTDETTVNMLDISTITLNLQYEEQSTLTINRSNVVSSTNTEVLRYEEVSTQIDVMAAIKSDIVYVDVSTMTEKDCLSQHTPKIERSTLHLEKSQIEVSMVSVGIETAGITVKSSEHEVCISMGHSVGTETDQIDIHSIEVCKELIGSVPNEVSNSKPIKISISTETDKLDAIECETEDIKSSFSYQSLLKEIESLYLELKHRNERISSMNEEIEGLLQLSDKAFEREQELRNQIKMLKTQISNFPTLLEEFRTMKTQNSDMKQTFEQIYDQITSSCSSIGEDYNSEDIENIRREVNDVRKIVEMIKNDVPKWKSCKDDSICCTALGKKDRIVLD